MKYYKTSFLTEVYSTFPLNEEFKELMTGIISPDVAIVVENHIDEKVYTRDEFKDILEKESSMMCENYEGVENLVQFLEDENED